MLLCSWHYWVSLQTLWLYFYWYTMLAFSIIPKLAHTCHSSAKVTSSHITVSSSYLQDWCPYSQQWHQELAARTPPSVHSLLLTPSHPHTETINHQPRMNKLIWWQVNQYKWDKWTDYQRLFPNRDSPGIQTRAGALQREPNRCLPLSRK